MVGKITEFKAKWRALDKEGKRFCSFWIVISFLYVLASIADGLGSKSKVWLALPIFLMVAMSLFLFTIVLISKYRIVTYPIKILDEDSRKKWFNNILITIYLISPTINLSNEFLDWAPVWVKIFLIVLWLSFVNYLLISGFNTPYQDPELTEVNAKPMEARKVLTIMAVGFILLVCFFGLLTYLNLQKVI